MPNLGTPEQPLRINTKRQLSNLAKNAEKLLQTNLAAAKGETLWYWNIEKEELRPVDADFLKQIEKP